MLPEEIPNSANEEQIKAGKSKAKIAESERFKAVSDLWATPERRSVLIGYLREFGSDRISYPLRSTSPNAAMDMAFLEGSRNAANKIKGDALAACPDLYFLGEQEAMKEKP